VALSLFPHVTTQPSEIANDKANDSANDNAEFFHYHVTSYFLPTTKKKIPNEANHNAKDHLDNDTFHITSSSLVADIEQRIHTMCQPHVRPV